jgi:sporulation protein YlmC with PRC-barrel domain
MMKKLMLGAAISALMLSGAMAQSTPAPSSPPAASPPPAAAPAPAPDKSAKPEAKPDKSAAKPDEANKSAAADEKGKLKFVDSQSPEQFLASKFKGTDVIGDDNKKIGDVSDILFDKDGKIQAYVISVGGFLGVGAKEIALAPSSFDVTPGENGKAPQLKLSTNEKELKSAQNFKAYEPPRPASTTGSGGMGGGGGLGGRGGGGGGMGR